MTATQSGQRLWLKRWRWRVRKKKHKAKEKGDADKKDKKKKKKTKKKENKDMKEKKEKKAKKSKQCEEPKDSTEISECSTSKDSENDVASKEQSDDKPKDANKSDDQPQSLEKEKADGVDKSCKTGGASGYAEGGASKMCKDDEPGGTGQEGAKKLKVLPGGQRTFHDLPARHIYTRPCHSGSASVASFRAPGYDASISVSSKEAHHEDTKLTDCGDCGGEALATHKHKGEVIDKPEESERADQGKCGGEDATKELADDKVGQTTDKTNVIDELLRSRHQPRQHPASSSSSSSSIQQQYDASMSLRSVWRCSHCGRVMQADSDDVQLGLVKCSSCGQAILATDDIGTIIEDDEGGATAEIEFWGERGEHHARDQSGRPEADWEMLAESTARPVIQLSHSPPPAHACFANDAKSAESESEGMYGGPPGDLLETQGAEGAEGVEGAAGVAKVVPTAEVDVFPDHNEKHTTRGGDGHVAIPKLGLMDMLGDLTCSQEDRTVHV